MKRILAWLAGLAGIAALGRLLARRRRQVETDPPPTEPTAADPAEELRRKLADARQAEPEQEPAAEPEQEPAAEPAEETLDERRARVHAKAREAIDAMGDDGAPT